MRVGSTCGCAPLGIGGRQPVRIRPHPPPDKCQVWMISSFSFLFSTDRRERPARRLKAPAVICSIGVVVTHLPSKQVSPVRIRHAAPRGHTGAVESPSFNWLQGTDLPAGFTPSGGYTGQRVGTLLRKIGGNVGSIPACSSRDAYVSRAIGITSQPETSIHQLTAGKDRAAGLSHGPAATPKM